MSTTLPTRGHTRADVVWLVWLGATLLVIGVAAGYLLTAIGADHTGELDASVWLTHHRPAPLAAVSMIIDVAIGQITAVCALATLVLILLVGGRGWSVLAEVLIFAAAMGSVEVVKLAFHRSRPPSPPVDRMVTLWDPQSMPSGHTAIATAIVSTVCVTAWFSQRVRMTHVLYAGAPLVLLVALSRVVVGAHYVGDVAVGVLISVGSTLLVVALLTHFDKLGPAVRGAKPWQLPGREGSGDLVGGR